MSWLSSWGWSYVVGNTKSSSLKLKQLFLPHATLPANLLWDTSYFFCVIVLWGTVCRYVFLFHWKWLNDELGSVRPHTWVVSGRMLTLSTCINHRKQTIQQSIVCEWCSPQSWLNREVTDVHHQSWRFIHSLICSFCLTKQALMQMYSSSKQRLSNIPVCSSDFTEEVSYSCWNEMLVYVCLLTQRGLVCEPGQQTGNEHLSYKK